MDLVLSGSMGNTSVALIKNKALKPGTVLLELLFVSEAVAPRAPARLLAAAAGLRCLARRQRQRPGRPGIPETLNDQLESVPRVSANKFVQAQRDVLAKQFDVAEGKIVPRHEERGQGQQQFAAAMDEELARLTAPRRSTRASATASWTACAPSARKAWPCSTRPPCASRRSASWSPADARQRLRETRSHGHPHGFFHFQRRPQRRMAARRPFARSSAPAAASRASQRNRDGRPDLLTSGKGPPAARVYSVL